MSSGSKKVIIAAFFGNLLIAITKFGAALITGSSAMFSEGIHSVVDTGNQVLLLYGLKRAQKPADENFPFGHGKEIYFWSFIVAILIFAAGAGISAYEGVHNLLYPRPMVKPVINYIVLAFAMVFEGVAWTIARRELARSKGDLNYFQAVRRGKNPSLFVVFFEDSAAMLGIVVAFTGILLRHITGKSYYDGAASIVIALILAGTAVWLAYETKSLLIGESAENETVENIRKLALSFSGIQTVNEVLTLHMGPEFILVNMSVDFDDNIRAGDVERILGELDRKIKSAHPDVKRVFIEPEPVDKTISRQETGGEPPV